MKISGTQCVERFIVMVMTWSCLLLMPTSSIASDKNEESMGHDSADKVVVAKVNGQTINMEQLMREMSIISSTKHGSEEVSPYLAEKIKKEALDKLVIEELAIQTATAKTKEVTSEQLEGQIQAVKQQYKTEEAFQKFVMDEYGGVEGLKKHLKRLLPLQVFISQEFDSKVVVTDAEVQAAYEAAKAQEFVTDEFVQVNDLQFFLEPNAPETKTKIAEVIKEISEKYNNTPGKYPGAGIFSLQKNIPLDKVNNKSLYEIAKGLKEYGWSAPITVDGNLHVVQLVGYKPAFNKSLQDATPQLKKRIWQQKRQQMLNAWMAGLKQGASIEVMDLSR